MTSPGGIARSNKAIRSPAAIEAGCSQLLGACTVAGCQRLGNRTPRWCRITDSREARCFRADCVPPRRARSAASAATAPMTRGSASRCGRGRRHAPCAGSSALVTAMAPGDRRRRDRVGDHRQLGRPADDELGDRRQRQASTICRAARSASIESAGIESRSVNQVNSSRCRPLNQALNGEPVRIRPGETVVTKIPSRASSARIAVESPVSANLLAQYGTRCGDADLAANRRDVDDAAAALSLHHRHRGPDRLERRPEMHVHRLFEIGGVHVARAVRPDHTGVVDRGCRAGRGSRPLCRQASAPRPDRPDRRRSSTPRRHATRDPAPRARVRPGRAPPGSRARRAVPARARWQGPSPRDPPVTSAVRPRRSIGWRGARRAAGKRDGTGDRGAGGRHDALASWRSFVARACRFSAGEPEGQADAEPPVVRDEVTAELIPEIPAESHSACDAAFDAAAESRDEFGGRRVQRRRAADSDVRGIGAAMAEADAERAVRAPTFYR